LRYFNFYLKRYQMVLLKSQNIVRCEANDDIPSDTRTGLTHHLEDRQHLSLHTNICILIGVRLTVYSITCDVQVMGKAGKY
jgi:hypothetical protein